MTRAAGRRRPHLLALAVCACILAGAGCGGDDEPEERTVTETVAETETLGAETETDVEGTIATVPDSDELPAGSEDEAEREIVNTLRDFNRTANLGKLQQACQNYFSEAFLARLPTERKCATTLAGARGGSKRAQMEVSSIGPIVDLDEGTATVSVAVGGGFIDPDNVREVKLVFEDDAWKIDAVNTAP